MASQTPQKTKKKIWFILAIIIVFLIIAIMFWQMNKTQNSQNVEKQKRANPTEQKAALTVTVVQPEQQNWRQSFTANGNIAAWQEVVISSELSGQRLTRVNVNVGDEVKRGQVLAEINSETIDFIVEKEPSNKNFREFLDFINKRLETNNITLILTIDNIDRLTKEKTKAIWSTINIFFAERSDKENYNNIWLIIPYDEAKVIQAFNEDESTDDKNEIGKGLIEKTFAVKFRVTPPIPTNWEVLFDELIIESFGEDISKEKRIDFDYVKRIFNSYKKEIITPREIINFINELITIYSLHKDINFKYLALFTASKDRILKEQPISAILSQDYLNSDIKIIFNEDTLLEKTIASITFGVPVLDGTLVLL